MASDTARNLQRRCDDADVPGMSARSQRIRLETARHVVEGYVQLPADGFRSRIKDFFNAHAAEFIALTDAVIAPHDGGSPASRHDFIAVSGQHVVLIVELPPEAPTAG